MSDTGKDRPHTIIVTGLSGSGKSVALHALEDIGFFCVDNLPVALIRTFVKLCRKTHAVNRIAIGVDIRERTFLDSFADTASVLRKTERLEIIYLEANDDILTRRYKETRRPHPLGDRDLKRAIKKEAQRLLPARRESDRIINTSSLSPHDLRNLLIRTYSGSPGETLSITIISFGYKYGTPSEADLLFDVRFLPNPNFIDELRDFPGTSKKVRDFVLSQPETKDFLHMLYLFLHHTIPLYAKEGRSYLTIGFGCTGGRHRSPAVVQEVRASLKRHNLDVSVVHRDLQNGIR